MKPETLFSYKRPPHDAVITFSIGRKKLSLLYFAQNGEMAYLGKMLRKLLLIHIKEAKKGNVLTEQEFKTAVKWIEKDFCREFQAVSNHNADAAYRYEVQFSEDGKLSVLPSQGSSQYFEDIN